MWRSASALLLCIDCQRSQVPLFVLPFGQDFERSRSSSTLVLSGLPSMGESTGFYLFGPHLDLYQSLNRLTIWNSQNCSMFPLAFVAGWLQGHWWGFISRNYVVWPTFFLVNVFIALKGSHFWFLFRISSAFKDIKLRFRTSALHWVPKIWSSAFRTSARPGLERSRSSSTLVLPGLPTMDKSTSAFHFCQDFQRSEIPLPHFCFALTTKDVKFCFLSSAVRSCYAVPHKFVRLKRNETGKNRNHLIFYC